jgi:putative MFS transporter
MFRRLVPMAVVVAALGYFVDIYDLLLFSIVRKASLLDIGVPEHDLLSAGTFLLNVQMGALLLGGLLWGTLGDKRGRLSVLFGSIVLYSLANIANGFVHTFAEYAVARFVAGIGLAGELGAGITLVSETLDKESRGYGTTIVASVGILGAVVGALVAKLTFWRTSYFIGGGLGLMLLALRVSVLESGMFQRVKNDAGIARGSFLRLLSSGKRARKYISVILVGVPIWYAVAILVTFSPEVGKAMGMAHPPDAAFAVMVNYAGLAVGDLASGALSQIIKSRKRAVLVFLLLTGAAVAFYFGLGSRSLGFFYAGCVLLGFSTGYWAVFVTVASEQFGTNIRATATTTAPNFVRGAVVPVTLAFNALKATSLGVIGGAIVVGAITLVLAGVALMGLDETYGKSLDFVD